jgi:hypothetical protein
MGEAFGPPVEPTALHRYFASLHPPMIVDTWYDGAMRAALGEHNASEVVAGRERQRADHFDAEDTPLIAGDDGMGFMTCDRRAARALNAVFKGPTTKPKAP